MNERSKSILLWWMVATPWIALLSVGLVVSTYGRFSNPGMTETQLLMRYWPAYVGTFFGAICMYQMIDEFPQKAKRDL